MGSERMTVCEALAARWPTIGALAMVALHVTPLGAQFDARFAPDPRCTPAYTFSAVNPAARDRDSGTLVIRLRDFDDRAAVWSARIGLNPLYGDDSVGPGVEFTTDTSGTPFSVGLPASRYRLAVHRVGFWPRGDTVAVRAGATDTVVVRLEEWGGEQNPHNCQPHRFRAPGESVCATDSDSRPIVQFARSLASPDSRKGLHLPRFSSAEVRVVRDEALCERAAKAYSDPGDPPRRVVVVRMGSAYLVIDPYEPKQGGEFRTYTVFDDHLRRIVDIAH